MKAIILTDDELKHLERRFGPSVRQMGPWSSDGTFGYSSVPIVAVEKAAEALDNAKLMIGLSRLTDTSVRTQAIIELLEILGPTLIEKIVDAYRRYSLELMTGPLPTPKPPQLETRRSTAMIAAG